MKKTVPKTALITGASSGIGAAFAHRLASKGYNLVLVARRKENLTMLTRALEQQYGITARFIVADLSCRDGIELAASAVKQQGHFDMLVNNAGFGTTGMFVNCAMKKHHDMVYVHVLASMHLIRAALPLMIAHGSGAIINVASLAAFIPMPGSVAYCATKSCLVAFSEALQIELISTGIKVQVLCPGYTYTEFHDTPEFSSFNRSNIPRPLWSSTDTVVNASLNALDQKQVICIPGLVNRFIVSLARNSVTGPFIKALAKRGRVA